MPFLPRCVLPVCAEKEAGLAGGSRENWGLEPHQEDGGRIDGDDRKHSQLAYARILRSLTASSPEEKGLLMKLVCARETPCSSSMESA